MKKLLKWILYILGGFVVLLIAGFIYLSVVSVTDPPEIADKSSLTLQRRESGNLYTLKNNWFRKSKSGLYELYVEGEPYERGVINGKLTRELVIRQEDHFNEQISKMIPSRFYLRFLKYFVGWFNRDLDKNITEEYKEEIYGISASASDNYSYIGSNYQRILNYHAAHDIGHALQSMALVGCTSFGTWNGRSEDSTLIIGRNFDFYVGDKFAEDKIVAFFNPSQGYKFMTVAWGGFIGAVSGMNEKGITVTINAAKTNIPPGSATPVSLVAREILQYAKNISEATEIASRRTMFVSESFLVGSAQDNKAVVIEKTPEKLDVYDPDSNFIVCANHFQSKGLAGSQENVEQLKESASPYRYKRMMELLGENDKNTVQKTVNILRDRKGLENEDIGLGNEKAVNQLIAHHAVVFEPAKQLVWVSTAPWQLGEFVAYDLRKIFAMQGFKQDTEITDSSLTIPADSFLQSKEYMNFERFRSFRSRISSGGAVDPDSIVAANPQYYHAWVLAGDVSCKNKDFRKALGFYEKALTREISTKKEEDYIRTQIENIKSKITGQ